MLSNNSNDMKKLAVRTLAKYGLNSVDEAGLKCMIAGEGYTVIRFSALGVTDEVSRKLNTLRLAARTAYLDSFTYADKEHRIVFVRKDISDDEFVHLLAVELGKILTFKTESDGVIGSTAAEERCAFEFAHHICDYAEHGIVYNFFKSYTAQCIFAVVSVVAVLILLISLFLIKSCNVSDTAATNDALNLNVTQIAENSNVPVISSENAYYVVDGSEGAYYVTKSGTKYHSAECNYISGKEVKALSAEELNSGKYSACSKCIK